MADIYATMNQQPKDIQERVVDAMRLRPIGFRPTACWARPGTALLPALTLDTLRGENKTSVCKILPRKSQ